MRTKPITLGIIGAVFIVGLIPMRIQSQTEEDGAPALPTGDMPPTGQHLSIPREMVKLYKRFSPSNAGYGLDPTEAKEAGDLIRTLLNRDGTTVDARSDAARRLGAMSRMESRIIEALLDALRDDPAPKVRSEAAAALGPGFEQDWSWRISEALVRSLRKDPNSAVRKAAAAALRVFGIRIQDMHVVMALVESVQENLESVPEVRGEAIKSLGFFRCRDGNDDGYQSLPMCQDYGILNTLAQAMSKDSNKEVRGCAAATLRDLLEGNKSRDPASLNGLILTARYEKDDRTRFNAVDALRFYSDNLAASAVLAEVLIYDESPEIRELAASRLENGSGNPYAVAALAHAASNDLNFDVRAQAEQSLKTIGNAESTKMELQEHVTKLIKQGQEILRAQGIQSESAATSETPKVPIEPAEPPDSPEPPTPQ